MKNEMRLIDANALFLLLKEQREKETGAYSKGRNNGINVAIGAIRNEQICPTVDAVEVVHARWKDGDCTACGFDIRDMIDGESEFRSWVWECVPYCPNCGAKMDGGNEDG